MASIKKVGFRTHSAALSIVPILMVTFAVIGSMSLLAKSAYETNEKQAMLIEQRRIELALDNDAREFADDGPARGRASGSGAGPTARPIDLDEIRSYVSTEHNVDFIAIYNKGGKLVSSVRPARNHSSAASRPPMS
jgi:hypothetical protein